MSARERLVLSLFTGATREQRSFYYLDFRCFRNLEGAHGAVTPGAVPLAARSLRTYESCWCNTVMLR